MKRIVFVPRLLCGWIANWLFAIGLPLMLSNNVLPYIANVLMLGFCGMAFTTIIELMMAETYKE